MRKYQSFFAFGISLLFATLAIGQHDAQARPSYQKVFMRLYPDDAKAKCAACHVGEKKTNRTEYGMAVEEALGGTNVKDEVAIEAALKKAEGKKPK